MVGSAIGDGEVAVGDGAGYEERASFDAVGDYGVVGAVEFFDAFDFQNTGAVADDLRTHFAQHDDQVGDFGFAGAILEDGFTVGQGGGH